MLDSGNFVLYNNSNSVIWESFDHPTDTILGGQNLFDYTDFLVSSVARSDHSRGRFCLTMQSYGKGEQGNYWQLVGITYQLQS